MAGGGIVALVLWMFLPSKSAPLPTALVESGEFLVDLHVTGRLRAENSVFITAPPARSNLQIIDMVPEGTIVKEGDFLIQFDTTDLRQQIDEALSNLEIARANFERSLASMASRIANLEASLENARASYRLAQLRMEQLKFEAEVRQEEGKLQLQQAFNALQQAEKELQAQKQIDSADIKNLEIKVKQAEADLEKLRSDLNKLTIRAPRPGLVVYKEVWRGGEMTKIKVGDTPWRGQTLIELPDLSVMLVETSVSELDISRIKVGLPAEITLEAYADRTFEGEVSEVAVLARTEGSINDPKMFDVKVRIKGYDPVLRPGMSARVRIIIDRLPNQVWVPIEAIFEKEGKRVVYVAQGKKFQKREVETGIRNDNFVVVSGALSPGERVALVDPTVAPSELATTTPKRKPAYLETETTSSSEASPPPDTRPRRRLNR
ncbi:MAG: efflux RND transporter periplasmic adaptor subunit [bacterium]